MSDYIKRDDVLSMVRNGQLLTLNEKWLLQLINAIPAADVVEHKISSWLVITCDGVACAYQCENCWHTSEDDSNYCPHCGADMLYMK